MPRGLGRFSIEPRSLMAPVGEADQRFPRLNEHGSSAASQQRGLRPRMPSRSGDEQELSARVAAGSLARSSGPRVASFPVLDRRVEPASRTTPVASRGSAAVRATLFLAFWLMISGWALADLPVGLAAVGGATWASLRLLPPKRSQAQVCVRLSRSLANFFRQSVVSGTDVAWRALNPNMNLKPGFVACPLRLPAGGAAQRVLRALEPDAGDAADRHERRGGASGSLPRHEPARRGQSRGGRAFVHAGGRR